MAPGLLPLLLTMPVFATGHDVKVCKDVCKHPAHHLSCDLSQFPIAAAGLFMNVCVAPVCLPLF